jgi:DNA-binding response OmpR family regulator
MPRAIILLIDDEPDLIELVRYNLDKEGFEVLSALDGESGLAAAISRRPDAVLVDLMLPGIDGLEVCSRLRQDHRTARIPVIMLTAKASEADRVVGLEIGADDYITKPFSPRELAARLKAVLRRAASHEDHSDRLRRGNLEINLGSHRVTCCGEEVTLTATEYRLLQFLAARPGRVYSRGELIDGALGRDVEVLERTVDVHLASLRKKLAGGGSFIETIRGFGYRFREDDGELPAG